MSRRCRRFAKGNSDSLPDTQNPLFAEAQAPYGEAGRRRATLGDPREHGDLPDVYIAMGQTAENVAQLTVSAAQEQDGSAVLSQNRAEKAIENGFFAREIAPVTLPDGTVVAQDDGPRAGITSKPSACSSRSSVPTAPSPRATPARSMTAPRRLSSCATPRRRSSA